MGQVPGDYPVSARYCTTWHSRPGQITLKYGHILGISNATLNVGICHATIFDARHCGVMRDRYLPTWYFVGEGRWQSSARRFNRSSDTAYNDVHIDRWSDYAMRYVASLAAFTAHWPGLTAWCFVYGDFYCDVIIMFRIVHYNKDLHLKIGNEKIVQ